MTDVALVLPEKCHEPEVLDYICEHIEHSEKKMSGSGGLHSAKTFDEWLERLHEFRRYKGDMTQIVPATTFLAVRKSDGRIVGMLQIRHFLNDYLMHVDGNIGFGVRPTERRKGYATEMLSLALKKCREMKMENVLVTCNKTNEASAAVIIKNGGIYENDYLEENGNYVERYWIHISTER